MIVEGFIDFDYEITLLTVRAIDADGDVSTNFCEPIGHVQVDGDYVESWQPQPMAPLALRALARHRAQGHGRSSAATASSASSCSSRATRSGSPKSARVRTTPAWSRWLAGA